MNGWRSLWLQGFARYLGMSARVVLDDEPPAHSGGRCTCDAGGVYHVQVSRDLEPVLAAKVLLHELGHVECRHVGPVTALTANPPPLLRAIWASDAQAKENEADCWAAMRWAELSGMQRQVLGGLARR